jgi:hypothetical protein
LAAEEAGRVFWRNREGYYRTIEMKTFLSSFGLWREEYENLEQYTWNNYPALIKALEGNVQVLLR